MKSSNYNIPYHLFTAATFFARLRLFPEFLNSLNSSRHRKQHQHSQPLSPYSITLYVGEKGFGRGPKNCLGPFQVQPTESLRATPRTRRILQTRGAPTVACTFRGVCRKCTFQKVKEKIMKRGFHGLNA